MNGISAKGVLDTDKETKRKEKKNLSCIYSQSPV
jgi:hypothetical protein